jgi:rhamnulokinase
MRGSRALGEAKHLLFLPDLFHYWLTGLMRSEVTIASTSQVYDPRASTFATSMLDRLGLNAALLMPLVETGSRLGPLLPEIAAAAGLKETPVFATACHDTASAVAAVPSEGGEDWCYISSGTWSLMGVELAKPIVTAEALAHNFTNEMGAGGRIRFLKNIAGLWLVQECRRAWSLEGHAHSYDELTELAEAAAPGIAKIDPDAFLEPGAMPEKIASYCKKTGQRVPGSPGEFVRVILESLASRYAEVLASLEAVTGRKIRVIHIVGGGSRNRLLNRLVAEATGRVVIAGPVEATAAGNVLVQAIGAGKVKSLEEARAIVRASFPVEKVTEPQRRSARG